MTGMQFPTSAHLHVEAAVGKLEVSLLYLAQLALKRAFSLLVHSGPALSLAIQNGSHLDCCSFFTSSSVRGSGKSRLITFAFTVPSSTMEPITAQYSSGAGARV